MSIIQYLIVCPLVFIAGFIDAIAGGGGLITLPAYLIAGLPTHNAIATNKMSSTMGTATATYRYAKNGYIPWKIALYCAVLAIVGAEIGASLSLKIDEAILNVVMLFLLPITAIVILKSKSLEHDPTPLADCPTIVIGCSIALVIGMYDGFYGPGAGTFLILLLTIVAHMKLTEANGVTKVINLSSNVTALAVFLINGKVIFPLGIIAGLFSIAGNYLGTKAFAGKGTKIAKPVMLFVLAVFIVKVTIEYFT